MIPALLLAVVVSGGAQAADTPIHVRNAQANPLDGSVTYEFVNDVVDVTAYEVSITRYFADGTTLVSTQGQDWFSSTGYAAVRELVYSLYAVWLPPYPDTNPGEHVHRLPGPYDPTRRLIDADVTVTAVIRLDGTATGRARVIERLLAARRSMLTEYSYWNTRIERAASTRDPQAALEWAVNTLARPRRDEGVAGPRESLLHAVNWALRWSQDHPDDAARLLAQVLKVVRQQEQFLEHQSIWRR